MKSPKATEETLLALGRHLKDRRRQPTPENFQRILRKLESEAFPTCQNYSLAGQPVSCRLQRPEWAQWLDQVWGVFGDNASTKPPSLLLDFVLEGPQWPRVADSTQGPPWLAYGAITTPQQPCWAYLRPQLRAWCQRGGRLPYRVVVALPSTDLTKSLEPMDLRKPLLLPLLDWLSGHPEVPFLGAILHYRGRGIALLGSPNSGKSTLLGQCLDAARQDPGWGWVADDPVLLSCSGSTARGRGLYLGSWRSQPGFHEKAFHSPEHWPRPWPEVPLSALVFPDYRAGQPHRLQRLSASQALRAWYPSLRLVPGRRDHWFEHQVTGLLQTLPAFRLEMGGRDPGLIGVLLECLA